MTEDELLYIKINYGIMTLGQISKNLNVPVGSLYTYIKKYKFKKQPAQLWYAIYRRDDFWFMATESECSRRLRVSKNTLRWYTYDKHIDRIYAQENEGNYNRVIAVNLGYYPLNEQKYHETMSYLNKKIFGEAYGSENE